MAKVKKKKIRRGKRRNNVKFYDDDNKWTLFHLNIQGFKSKSKSFNAIMSQVNANCITLNETCLRKRQKMQISNYKYFTRNRCDGQIMGGISTFVCDMEKDYVVQTKIG